MLYFPLSPSLSLSFPSDLFTGLINGRWCFDSHSKSAVPCATCDSMCCNIHTRPENGLPANWTWNCPSGVNKLTSFPYPSSLIRPDAMMKDDSRISPRFLPSLLSSFFSLPRIWNSVFDENGRNDGRTAARGHFETANYEQRFVNHYSTFNYGGWMPGMGDIATLVATHAALSIQYWHDCYTPKHRYLCVNTQASAINRMKYKYCVSAV